MEKMPNQEKEITRLEYLTTHVGLVRQLDGKYLLAERVYSGNIQNESSLEHISTSKPDGVLRPEGDTTIFTSAGIQHLETLERDKINLESEKFKIAQPVVRSQFMDKIKEGYSTAFIDEAIVQLGVSDEDFFSMCKQMVIDSLNHDTDIQKYYLTIDIQDDRWGQKKFTKLVVTLYYDGNEVSEGVYIDKFPKVDGQTVSVAETTHGAERYKWIHRENKDQPYFIDFEEFYHSDNKDDVARIIDPVRTATLMLMQGVVPSHKDPGFRLRQLIKRFVERNAEASFSEDRLLNLSYDFWLRNNVEGIVDKVGARELLKKEMIRAQNVHIVNRVERDTGKKIKVDVNLGTDEFIKRIYSSSPEEIIGVVKSINLKRYE
ncbi:MAG: hypothetical protein M0R51_10750 [Clostridia bacterium]|jgi:hypothetical protein|nr:hypothetical protein [Clostridia bacterium]